MKVPKVEFVNFLSIDWPWYEGSWSDFAFKDSNGSSFALLILDFFNKGGDCSKLCFFLVVANCNRVTCEVSLGTVLNNKSSFCAVDNTFEFQHGSIFRDWLTILKGQITSGSTSGSTHFATIQLERLRRWLQCQIGQCHLCKPGRWLNLLWMPFYRISIRNELG